MGQKTRHNERVLDPHTRALQVDDRMRAGDRLWAIGDITGKGAFTHVSMYQAEIAFDDIAGVAAFLVGPDAAWVTGQHILANGGSGH